MVNSLRLRCPRQSRVLGGSPMSIIKASGQISLVKDGEWRHLKYVLIQKSCRHTYTYTHGHMHWYKASIHRDIVIIIVVVIIITIINVQAYLHTWPHALVQRVHTKRQHHHHHHRRRRHHHHHHQRTGIPTHMATCKCT